MTDTAAARARDDEDGAEARAPARAVLDAFVARGAFLTRRAAAEWADAAAELDMLDWIARGNGPALRDVRAEYAACTLVLA